VLATITLTISAWLLARWLAGGDARTLDRAAGTTHVALVGPYEYAGDPSYIVIYTYVFPGVAIRSGKVADPFSWIPEEDLSCFQAQNIQISADGSEVIVSGSNRTYRILVDDDP
jgi:hypothetical protein